MAVILCTLSVLAYLCSFSYVYVLISLIFLQRKLHLKYGQSRCQGQDFHSYDCCKDSFSLGLYANYYLSWFPEGSRTWHARINTC